VAQRKRPRGPGGPARQPRPPASRATRSSGGTAGRGGRGTAAPGERRAAPRGAATSGERRPFLTPGASPFRQRVERRSATVVVFLSRLPRALPGLIVAGLVLAALVLPPVASGVAMLVVAALLTWLVYLSWPGVPPPGRAVRLVVIAIVVAYAAARIV
jgi:hypothetical protein